MAKMKMKVDVNVLELDGIKELIEVLRGNLLDLPKPVADVLERVVNKPIEYGIEYFTDRGLYDLKVLADEEPGLNVIAVSPEGKYIRQMVLDDLGNYTLVDECIQTKIVPCDRLKIRDSKGNPVAKELWW